MKKVILISLRILIVAVAAALIEVFVINLSFFIKSADKSVERNIEVDKNYLYCNWEEVEGVHVSGIDPNILCENINEYAETVTLYIDYGGNISYIDIYYTNEEHPVICEETWIRYDSKLTRPAKVKVNIGAEMGGLRIDLGDDAGVILYDIDVVLNENKFDFSWARFIAMNMIYWLACLLFAMQRPPKYNI